jgi:structural maintenance of chromosome 2
MHIQEIVVDGFKSYAHRTVIAGYVLIFQKSITGIFSSSSSSHQFTNSSIHQFSIDYPINQHRFDPHFNAITGLNGSGKSNILDAICFVLGITNLSQVRAGNLSELVYKQGQAGINKASVTVVFNNSDESASPVGYEQCSEVTVTRQVLIGGKSKYLINGRVSPAGQVANLFHSVQLNVNNPHFLIMQGRITKVLNMKPNEILGMVEEAAGTRMYENKRVGALKTIEKKQKKVDEINSVLNEEITPTLERLRGEKQHYLKWNLNKTKVEGLKRFVVASEYVRAQELLHTSEDHTEQLEAQVQLQEDNLEKCKVEMERKEEEIDTLTQQLNGTFGSELKDSKSIEEKLSKELVKTTSAWQNSLQTVQKAKDDLDASKALAEETKEAEKNKEVEVTQDTKTITQVQQEALEVEKEAERLTKEYQNMCAGISSSEGDEGLTLPDQISKAYNDANNADAKAKQATMKLNHLKKSVKVSFYLPQKDIHIPFQSFFNSFFLFKTARRWRKI